MWEIVKFLIVIGETKSDDVGILYATQINIVICDVFLREHICHITYATRGHLVARSTLIQIHIRAKTSVVREGGALEMAIIHHWTPIDNHLVMDHNVKHSAYMNIAAYILDQHCAAAVDIRLQSRTKDTGVGINAGESWLQVLHHTSSLLGDLLSCHMWVIHDDCCVSVKTVEQPGKDPRANESGSKGCRKIARGASARAARHIHPIPAKQYDGVAPSISPTGADSSIEHADRGSVLKGRTRERMSYAEAARGKLPFQLP
jgi:hypothetical protein